MAESNSFEASTPNDEYQEFLQHVDETINDSNGLFRNLNNSQDMRATVIAILQEFFDGALKVSILCWAAVIEAFKLCFESVKGKIFGEDEEFEPIIV